MSDAVEFTVDGTTLLGGAVGAVIATLWSTAPVFLSGSTAALFTRNQKLLILLGTAVTAGTVLYRSDFEDGIAVPQISLYTGVIAFLLVGAVGYAVLPVASTVQGQQTPSGQLTSDNLRVATLKVDGMVCQGCKMTVRSYLSSMDGTKQVDVNLGNQQATVVYDASVTSARDLVNADVFRGTYTATLVNDKQYDG